MMPSARFVIVTRFESTPSSCGALPSLVVSTGQVLLHLASQLETGGFAVSLSNRYSTKPWSSVTTSPILGTFLAISFVVTSVCVAGAAAAWSCDSALFASLACSLSALAPAPAAWAVGASSGTVVLLAVLLCGVPAARTPHPASASAVSTPQTRYAA